MTHSTAPAPQLALTYRAFDRVEFEALLPTGVVRAVCVRVGSGPTWASAIRFPHSMTEGGESLGDDALDERVRSRAAEELVRLVAARAAA